MKFIEYLKSRDKWVTFPILVSLIALLIDIIMGLLVISAVVLTIVMVYFVVGRGLEYEKPEKKKTEDDIYIFKDYYNRVMTLRSIQGSLLFFIVLMGIIAGDFFPTLLFLSIMVISGAIVVYLNDKTITIEKIGETKVDGVFWWNRHNREVCRSNIHNKVLFLAYIIGIVFLFSMVGLAFAVIETYRLIVMFVSMILCLSIVVELFFSITFGFEDFEPTSIGEQLSETEPIRYHSSDME